MTAQFCTHRLDHLTKLVQMQQAFMLILCVFYLVFSLTAAFGNLLSIRALWKASSIPDTVKKLFLSLAFSDLAVGIISQPLFGVIIAVMLKMASTGDYTDFVSFCPTILTVYYYFDFLLSCASFLNVIAIAVDRLLAISLHLRYQELVTSKRVIMSLACLWLTSAVVASIFISLPHSNDLVAAITVFIGLFLTTVAYVRIYKVVRYHQNQIQSQTQLQNSQTMELLLRQKKFAKNAFFVYVVFLACYLPLCIAIILDDADSLRISFLAGKHACIFLVLLNSSLNPLVYCWRYQEIRQIVKSTMKQIFCMNE